MIFKNEDGRAVEMEVWGGMDDVQVDEAYYVDTGEEVSGEDVEFILDRYAAEVEEILQEKQQLCFDLDRERD